MRRRIVSFLCTTVFALLVVPSHTMAQQKTVRACQEEWRANKAANQARGITEKAYIAQCRGGGAAAAPTATAPSPAATAPTGAQTPTSQKTVRACLEEWRANKAANQASGITEKAYVAQCRGGGVTAAPTAAPSAPAPTPSAATPGSTPATTTSRPTSKPGTTAAAPPTTPPAAGTPVGAGQFATEAEAMARCPSDTVVWVNTRSKIYHFKGYKNYGNTLGGAYMCEKDTAAQGMRASKTEKHP
jgi:hypothetical protein